MDGNFRLVRKVTAGSSDYPPHHNNRFFLPKEDVEPFLLTTPVAHNQVSIFYVDLCFMTLLEGQVMPIVYRRYDILLHFNLLEEIIIDLSHFILL